MEYDDHTGNPKGKFFSLYLFNDRLLFARREVKGFGTLKNFKQKFESLEDLSLVNIEQYSLGDGLNHKKFQTKI